MDGGSVGRAPPRVLCVVGTRPEAIKMAPVVAALQRQPGLRPRLLLTGQHPDLAAEALAGFGLRADLALPPPPPGRGLSALAGALLGGLDPALAEEAPAMVLAQGDTTTVLAAAIAAFHRRIPFGHVEAGLRSGDPAHPFPEEFNRQVAARAAALHFAPTPRARAALLAEGVPPAAIHLTGNPGLDALFATLAAGAVPPPGLVPPGARLALVTLHRRENQGAPAQGLLRAVAALAAAVPDLVVVLPLHPNPALAAVAGAVLGGHPRIRLVPPLPHAALVALLRRAALVLTDSGGLQEEAPALGVPVLVLRERTERPEAVEAGVARLVGTDPGRVLAAARRLLEDPAAHAAMARGASPYGDGRAAPRIAALVARHLGLPAPRLPPFALPPARAPLRRGAIPQPA